MKRKDTTRILVERKADSLKSLINMANMFAIEVEGKIVSYELGKDIESGMNSIVLFIEVDSESAPTLVEMIRQDSI